MNDKDMKGWIVACMIVLTAFISAWLFLQSCNQFRKYKIAKYELLFIRDEWTAFTNSVEYDYELELYRKIFMYIDGAYPDIYSEAYDASKNILEIEKNLNSVEVE